MSESKAYESAPYSLEKILALALFASLGLHILASWIFFFVIPAYQASRADSDDNIITVQLMGAIAPPAPAAPALPVDPNLKGPDVVEVPAAPPPPAEKPLVEEPLVSVPDPADVIPLAEKPDKPQEIKKIDEKPPDVKPVARKEEVKPKPKPKPSLDAQINQRLRNLEQKRKTAAENPDDLINQRMMNLAAARGQGQGEGSDMYGGATTGERLDPEKARYYSHIRDIVSKNWVAPSSALSSSLTAIYQIKIEPDGRVSASRLRTSSGNSDYDLSVERAVRQSSPFPPLPAVFGGKPDNPALRFGLSDMRAGNY